MSLELGYTDVLPAYFPKSVVSELMSHLQVVIRLVVDRKIR